MTAQPLNEYTVNGKQIFNLYAIGNPDAVPPDPLTPLITTVIDPTGFDTNGLVETWENTHTTVTRTKSLNSLSNPQILAVQKAILVCNNNTVPTASIGMEADNSGGIGTYYGMNLYNDNDLNFDITSTMPYQGAVVFRQEGALATTTTTAIKQGEITIDDPTLVQSTTFLANSIASTGTNDFTISTDQSQLVLTSSNGNIQLTTPFETFMNTASPSTGDGVLYVKNILMEGPDNATSVLQTHSANQTSNTGYARLELDSGNIAGVIPPRVTLQAFSDATQSPPYPANVNKIDLGGANGDQVLITCGNLGETLPETYLSLFTDANDGTNNIAILGVSDPVTGIGGAINFGSTAYSMTLQNQLVQTVSSLGDIVNRRNLSFGTGYTSLQCGIIEKTALNAVTSGTTTLTTANAFQTTMNTPLSAGRIFVLPAPSAGTIGLWYGICNKSTAQTIAIQYPAATTIATIAVSPSATNGGTVARFAVDYTGTTYSRIA